jgi:hypothetical protein
MRGKDWRGKGEMALRRRPRKTGKKCGRPFTAPRTVRQNSRTTTKRKTTETEDSDVQVMTDSEVQKITEGAKTMEDNNDSEVQSVTETENERNIIARQDTLQQVPDTLPRQETTVSDSTDSTPDIFRSPDSNMGQLIATDVVGDLVIRASPTSVKYKGKTYQGVMHVEETEDEDKSSDSED